MYQQRRLDEVRYMTLLCEACHPQVAKYFKRKGFSYPKINEQAKILESLGDSIIHSDEDLASWLSLQNL